MPVLSRGKHRSPKKGACFMELAVVPRRGEPWSDHPSARIRCSRRWRATCNDHVDDYARTRLAPLIPEVIGLNGDDPRVGRLDRPGGRPRGTAGDRPRSGRASRRSGLLRCERMLNQLEGRSKHHVDPRTAARLDEVPQARDWARGFSALGWGQHQQLRQAQRAGDRALGGLGIAAAAVCRRRRHPGGPGGSARSCCAASGSATRRVRSATDLWRETVRMTHRWTVTPLEPRP
jgi:hypothetical protein